MSGLATLVGGRSERETLRRMAEAAPHRGPSGPIHVWEGGGAMIQGEQPGHPFTRAGLHREQGFCAAVAGCLFEGSSVLSGERAAERVGVAYLSKGPEAIDALPGSFAGVVVDLARGRVFAARSAPGERPLFWRRESGTLALATEVKQLLAAPMPPPSVDQDVLLSMAAADHARPDRTAFRGIHRVRAGTWMEFDADKVRRGRMWDPAALVGTSDTGLDEALREFRRLMGVAVARRLGPDCAILMSGGLDSTPIAAEASNLFQKPDGETVSVVSATYPEHPGVDESGFVRQMEQALRLRVVWTRPRPRLFADVDSTISLHDGPSSGAMTTNLMQILAAAREAGFRSLLDGHDGDTVFGTQRGLARALLRRGALRQWGRYAGFVRRRYRLAWPTVLRRYLIAPVVPAAVRSAYRRARQTPPSPTPEWIRQPLTSLTGADRDHRDWFAEEVMAYENGSLEVALETLERIALSSGLTLLHPLADPELVEFLVSLPPEVKFADGRTKSLVRLAYPEIPSAVRDRAAKTMFDDTAVAAAPQEDVLAAIRAGPRRLPGVDWNQLERRVERGGMAFPEIAIMLRVVQADRFLDGR